MKHYLLTLLLLTMAAMTALGQQTVSVEEAQAKAAAFLNRSAGAKGGTVTTDVQLAYTAQQGNETYYYVFNNGSNGQGGFVIIGGDKTARTILGYSDNGAFDPNNMPENMKWWLSQYEQQISAAIKNGGTTAAAKGGMGLKSIAQSTIGPLCGTKWDQRAPYNTAIPKIHSGYDYTSDNAPATGCVATAMAQIMKKYKHPTTGTGSKSYSINYSGTVGTKTYSANFGSTTYLWNEMTDTYTYNTYSSTDAENAVATLMYHCGVAASMTYNTIYNGGSSADALNAAWGMATYFDYDKGMSYERRAFYTDEAWAQMIYTELVNGRPVLYSGRTSANQGHSFVCEGYKYEDENDLFYLNWGWSGNYNGYFPLQGTASGKTALTPDGTGTGGGAEGAAYDQEQTVVIGIQPDQQGSKLKIKMLCEAFSIATSGSAGSSVEYSGSFFNNSVQPTDLTFGIRLVNQSTNAETDIESGTWSNVNPNSGYNTSSSVTVPANTPVGTYSAYPIYKDENGAWQKMDSEVAAQTITIMAAGEGLVVEGTPSVSNGGYVTPSSGTYTIRLWNNSSSPQTNVSFRLWIYKLVNETQLKGIGLIDVTESFIAQETKDVVFDFANYSYQYVANGEAMTAGNTYYAIPHQGSTELTKEIDFQCTTKLDIAYKLSTIGWGTLCLPFNAEKPVGMTLYEVSSVNGNELTKTEATKIEMNKAYLVSGTAGTYNFSGPTMSTGVYTNGLLTGNTNSTAVSVPVGSYVLQNLTTKSGLAFYRAATNSQLCSPYKAYLTLPSGSTSLYSALLFTDGTTGIESIEATDNQQGAVRKVLKNGRLTIETPQGSFTPAGARMK